MIRARHDSTGKIIFLSPQRAQDAYSTYAGLTSVTVDSTNVKIRTAHHRLGRYIDDSDVEQRLEFADASVQIVVWQ